MLSRLFLALYRWSLRRSGHQGTSIEYEHTTKVPVKTEYIGPATSVTIASAERCGVPVTATGSIWHTWRVAKPKN